MILNLDGVTKNFGGVRALSDVSFSVESGDILGLIGPNGAGKTTLFNCITGHNRCNSGSILFGNQRLNRLAPHQITSAGISRTFQNIRLFGEMSVLENVMAGAHCRMKTGFAGSLLRTRSCKDEERNIQKKAEKLLDFIGLYNQRHLWAKNLPYGAQRRLEIVRAMASDPKLLLLDEPAAGMNPSETTELMKYIRSIRDTDITVLLIEHHMKVVMNVCNKIVVLDYGVKIAEGTPEEVRSNPMVIEAYLGLQDTTHANA